MAYQDRNTYVTPPRGGSSAGWFIAGILVAAMIGGGVLYYNGYFHQEKEVSIELKVPDVKLP
ncbi:hypothetical protein [Roseibium litorale]|uniref:Uncharacterized protein n=1 Tax=Roseibium litorale TaxID=2803841 RepID=A0ABR9CJS0_9HYPH|nr:hypothetical protein [Roseibium litorale]MBD8890562.1 hypothetical protein [Roseibium litorale]